MGVERIGWRDAREIGYRLWERYPDEDPTALRFTELHRRVLELEGFEGDPKASDEGILEAILLAWLDERD